jgi:arylsulfatase A
MPKNLISLMCWLTICLTTSLRAASPAIAEDRRPNFVIFFADDLGYADLNCFGGIQMVTPHLDRMADQGMRLTSFYVSQAVCSASRASLLTGCYNGRVGIQGALGPGAKVCLNPDETTIADMLRGAGYATGVFGKWHLGDRDKGLPIYHGFDEYHGLPYSNDMWPFHPTATHFPPLPLFLQEAVINSNVTAADQQNLTRWSADFAIDFINRHREQPFFVYVPFSMPHVPLFASEQFQGATGKGLYVDVIAEIDSSVGRVLETLEALGLTEKTMVLFTSDNGPWLSYGNHAGSAEPFREGKGTTWEGGVRVPAIACRPGHIPAGSLCDEIMGTIDILPTLAELTGSSMPEQKIDGQSVWPLLRGDADAASPHQAWYYYWTDELQAVRCGKWKLHFPHSYRTLEESPGKDGVPARYTIKQCGLELYDLQADPGESKDEAGQYPEVVKQLSALADSKRQQLGDSLTEVKGTENRPHGVLP